MRQLQSVSEVFPEGLHGCWALCSVHDIARLHAASAGDANFFRPLLALGLARRLGKGKQRQVRRKAAAALAVLGKAAALAVKELASALAEDDIVLRQAAARALGAGSVRFASAVPALSLALADSDAQVRLAAADALSKLGLAALPAMGHIFEMLDQENTSLRRRTLESVGALARLASPAVPGLANALVAPLVQSLSDEDTTIRLVAMEALSSVGESAAPAVNHIAATLGDETEDQDVRIAAARALSRCGSAAAAASTELLDALQDPDWEVGAAAADTIGRLAGTLTHVAPAIKNLLASSQAGVREKAADILGCFGSTGALEMTALLEDSSWSVRCAAVRSLAKMGIPSIPTLNAIQAFLRHSDPGVRYGAADVLGKLGHLAAAAVPQLQAVSSADEDWGVREMAAEALDKCSSRVNCAS